MTATQSTTQITATNGKIMNDFFESFMITLMNTNESVYNALMMNNADPKFYLLATNEMVADYQACVNGMFVYIEINMDGFERVRIFDGSYTDCVFDTIEKGLGFHDVAKVVCEFLQPVI